MSATTWQQPRDAREHGEAFRLRTLDGPHGVRAVGTLADREVRWHLDLPDGGLTPDRLADVAAWLHDVAHGHE